MVWAGQLGTPQAHQCTLGGGLTFARGCFSVAEGAPPPWALHLKQGRETRTGRRGEGAVLGRIAALLDAAALRAMMITSVGGGVA